MIYAVDCYCTGNPHKRCLICTRTMHMEVGGWLEHADLEQIKRVAATLPLRPCPCCYGEHPDACCICAQRTD